VSLIKKHSQVAGLKNRIRTFLPFQTTGAQGYLAYCFSSLECVVAWSTPDISFPTQGRVMQQILGIQIGTQ